MYENHTLKLLLKCYQNEWNQWLTFNGLHCLLKNINWVEVWKEGLTRTQQIHYPTSLFNKQSITRYLRRPSDNFIFVGTEETFNRYDQEYYIRFSAVLLTSSIIILPFSAIGAYYFQNLGGVIASLFIWLTSINHW